MHLLDWVVVGVVVLGLAGIGIYTRRYMLCVADFLAANRCAGRYLLTMADGVAGLGAISVIAEFEKYYQAGFAAKWWDNMFGPVGMFLTITGYIIYRFRASRAMTMAEFFEMRYSRRFRIFTGILACFSGIINYGIFPSVTARFFIYFCDLPVYTWLLGPLTLNLTLGVVMFFLLGTAVLITFRGGQIAVMVTDFIQAQYINLTFLIILVVLLLQFSWSDLTATLETAPAGESKLNPFEQSGLPDFNPSFYFMYIFNLLYGWMAWQGTQAYNCSARSPHEAKMARILGSWRMHATGLVIFLVPICAWVLINGDIFPDQAQAVNQSLTQIEDSQIRTQVTVPVALRTMLPVGIFGLFVAGMLAAAVSTDDSYLHSWGSILIQDVVMPFRKKPLEPQQHIRWLRNSIIGVAVFAWTFSMLFPLKEYIYMYFALTGAIYLGGAGAVIIGGFYWKRATTAGAWAGMVVGSSLAVCGVVLNNIAWPYMLPALRTRFETVPWIQNLPLEFPLNGMQISFGSALCAIVAYVVVSLLTRPDPAFEMDRLLRRGKYRVPDEHIEVTKAPGWLGVLGIDSECTRFDRFLIILTFGWTMFWFVLFVVGTLYCLNYDTTDSQWAVYWLIQVILGLVIGAVTVVWFLVAGFRDLAQMFRDLRLISRNVADDGFVPEEEE